MNMKMRLMNRMLVSSFFFLGPVGRCGCQGNPCYDVEAQDAKYHFRNQLGEPAVRLPRVSGLLRRGVVFNRHKCDVFGCPPQARRKVGTCEGRLEQDWHRRFCSGADDYRPRRFYAESRRMGCQDVVWLDGFHGCGRQVLQLSPSAGIS